MIRAIPRATRLAVLGATLLAGPLAGPASADVVPETLEQIVNWEIEAGCGRDDGRVTAGGLIERDLTGDGLTDLIVDHAGIRCAGDRPSGFCRRDDCAFRIYVDRDGRLLAEALERGVDLAVDDDGTIRWTDRKGDLRSLRWSGRRFE